MDKSELKARLAVLDSEQRVALLVDQLASELNIMGNEELVSQAFVNAIQSQHRTIQQSMMGALVFKTIHAYKDAPHDLRNQASVEACKRIDELLQGEQIHLPFI